MRDIMARTNLSSPKCHKEEAKHVEGSHSSTNGSYPIQQRLGMWTGVSFLKDQILAVISRKARNPSDRDTGNQKCYSSDGHLSQQTTHFADVLFVAHAVDHTPSTKKE